MSILEMLLKYSAIFWIIVQHSIKWLLEFPIYLQKFCIKVVKTGPIPCHIAIIMDGNRRYATKANIGNKEGYEKGYDILYQIVDNCILLGVQNLTVYAFSIENFKRVLEVDMLLDLFREKLKQILNQRKAFEAKGIRVRVIGNTALLPQDLRNLAAKVMITTKQNNNFFLNLAVPYTSKDELTTTAGTIVQGVNLNLIDYSDINEQLVSDCLFTNHRPDPDILVRTSGEVRFSDFLLWQCGKANVYFVGRFWPTFNMWCLLTCVLLYQRHHKDLNNRQAEKMAQNAKVMKFLEWVDEVRTFNIEADATL